MQATILGKNPLTVNNMIIVPYPYASVGKPMTVMADMNVTAIESPTGICKTILTNSVSQLSLKQCHLRRKLDHHARFPLAYDVSN